MDTADQIFINGKVYTVNDVEPWVEAFATNGDQIVATGTSAEMQNLAGNATQTTDLEGRFVMPGFIEGHAHFGGLGNSVLNLNLLATTSWAEIIDSVRVRAERAEPGDWIYGRGWHQEKWTDTGYETVDGYPLHDALSEVSPNNPVVLTHASGHGAMANAAAMKAAGISSESSDPEGGRILRNAHGEPIGVFEERATAQLYEALKAYYASLPVEQREAEQVQAWKLASQACIEAGITSFQDAGTSRRDLDALRVLAKADSLDVRLWMMLRESCEEMAGENGSAAGLPWVGIGNNKLTVRAIKTELDGALGSYGAWLLEDYSDKPGFRGQNTTTIEEVACIADLAFSKEMQLCVHAIGDRANKETLDIVERYSSRVDSALRWRNEHSQHIAVEDIPRFAATGTIASMQGIHATSDAPFVVARLGIERARTGAYAWRSLLDAGAVVTNGTDAPVEEVSALASLYAMITRQQKPGGEAFFPEQSLTRQEAIYAYTMANAYAAFEEDEKGSIASGKLADFIVLDRNLVDCPVDSIPSAGVLRTFIGAEEVYTAL
ncbi:MAG: amidohydrolase [Saprospiraceae bacterium]